MRRRDQSQTCKPAFQPLYIRLHHGAEVSVHHGGGQPLELTELGGHVMGNTGERFGELFGQDAGGGCFVLSGDEAVEEADRDRGYAGGLQGAHRRSDGCFIEWYLDRAVVPQAFGNFHAQGAVDQNNRLVGLDVVQVGPFLPPDLQQVAEAVGGDQPGARALVLDQGIRRHRRAMAEIADGTGGRTDAVQSFRHAGGDPAGRIVWCGRDLPHRHLAGFVVEQTDVGKGPP